MNMLMKYIGKKNIEVNSVMILGGSPIGEMVARQLSKQLDSVKLIEMNKEKCLDLSENLPSNVIVVNGDGRNSDMLLEESIRDYDAFIAVTNSSETNILACVAAKASESQERLQKSRTSNISALQKAWVWML